MNTDFQDYNVIEGYIQRMITIIGESSWLMPEDWFYEGKGFKTLLLVKAVSKDVSWGFRRISG